MNLHKAFRELFELSHEDNYTMRDLLEMVNNARNEFDNVGVPFTYEGFKQWFNKVHISGHVPPYQPYVKLQKIIEGDNLDQIEDAAKDKGLI